MTPAGKLSRAEAALIVATVFGAWFLGALLGYGDWARALGSSVWGVALGFGLVITLNRRRST